MAADENTPLRSHDAIKTADEVEESSVPPYVYVIAACATINSVNLGFDIGVNSGAGLLIQEDFGLTDWQLGVFMGSIHFVAALGGLVSHEFTDRLGRRLSFAVAQLIFLIGVAILCLAQSYHQLLLSRVFLGMALGISLALGPLYISEISPASHRGRLTTCAEVAINVGILIGFISNWAFADWPTGVNWRIMIACGAVLPVVLIALSLTVMPESPRWLIAQGNMSEAQEILASTHPPGEDVAKLVDGIKQQVERDAGYAELGWDPLLRPDSCTRRLMMVGIGVAFAQQATAIESIVMYSPSIFRQAGVATSAKDLFIATIQVGVVKTICIVIAAAFLDSVGRRPMLLVSSCGMALSHVIVAVAFFVRFPMLAAGGVLLFVAFFSLGIGPITWIFAAEVFPLHIRAKALSVATTVNRLGSATVALTFLPLADFLSFAGYFLLFAFIVAISAVIQYFTVPETKGLVLERVSECFAKDA